MNRDVRFSNDKSPYKTAHAALSETDGGSLHYVQISANGLFLGAGIYHAARDQVDRLRGAIADDRTGPELEQAIAAVRGAGLEVSGGMEDPLKTAPRGYAKDHPRIDLLRWKGCISSKELGTPKWIHTKQAAPGSPTRGRRPRHSCRGSTSTSVRASSRPTRRVGADHPRRGGQPCRWMRSPVGPKIPSTSTGPSMAPNQCGVHVLNSTASPGSIVRSSSPSTSRRRPAST